jgi:hypothetical protein
MLMLLTGSPSRVNDAEGQLISESASIRPESSARVLKAAALVKC